MAYTYITAPIEIEIQPPPRLNITLNGVTVNVVHEVPEYEGVYTVTPDFFERILPTANKYLTDNVTVKKIPLYDVQNTSGGITTIIGGDDYIA